MQAQCAQRRRVHNGVVTQRVTRRGVQPCCRTTGMLPVRQPGVVVGRAVAGGGNKPQPEPCRPQARNATRCGSGTESGEGEPFQPPTSVILQAVHNELNHQQAATSGVLQRRRGRIGLTFTTTVNGHNAVHRTYNASRTSHMWWRSFAAGRLNTAHNTNHHHRLDTWSMRAQSARACAAGSVPPARGAARQRRCQAARGRAARVLR